MTETREDHVSTVYLIHFERAHYHARHYVGCTEDLGERIKRHRQGRGARLIKAIQELGIRWVVARVWDGDRALERRLKGWKGSNQLCPICRGEVEWDDAVVDGGVLGRAVDVVGGV